MFKSIKNWNIENATGYKPLTTYYTDFGIAERFGINAIKNTLKDALKYNSNYKVLTEIIMVLNWKIWEHYESNENIAKLYNDLYYKTIDDVIPTFTPEQKQYYYNTID